MKIKMYTMFTPTSPSGKQMKSPQSAIQVFNKLQKTHMLWVMVLLGVLNTSIVSAQQTVLLTEDFQGSSLTAKGWSQYKIPASSPCSWTTGTISFVGAQPSTSTKAYLTSDGSTRGYTMDTQANLGFAGGDNLGAYYLFKPLTVAANQNSVKVIFDWEAGGYRTVHQLNIRLVKKSTLDAALALGILNPIYNAFQTTSYTTPSSTYPITGGEKIGTGYCEKDSNTAAAVTLTTTTNRTLVPVDDYYVVFRWMVDKSSGTTTVQPPAPAIDNITVKGYNPKFISVTSGDWSTASTWNNNEVPTAKDEVLVSSGHVVTIPSNITITGNTITVDGTLNTNNYVISGTGNLTISNGGTLQVQQATGLVAAVTVTGTTTFATGSTLELNGTVAQSVAALNLTNANVKVNNAAGVTATGAFNVASITVESGKIFNAGALTHTLSGASRAAWTNSGTANMGTSTLVFTGAAGTITGATDFYNLTLNSGASTTISSGASKVNNVLIVNGALTANSLLTLVSTASINSRVGVSTGSASGVKVQRYIAMGRRAFRFLTPGVTTTTPISSNWQLGTHITGSTTGANGFDLTASGNPSLFVYNNQVASGTGWSSVPNTNATTLTSGVGYRLLLRGDRHDPLVIVNVTGLNMNAPVTLEATGSLTTGTVTMNASSVPPINNTTHTTTNGFSLVGNPYMSPIDWHLVTKSGLEQSYYTWEADMGTAVNRGKYVVYNTSTGKSDVSSSITRYIQPNQAFFVKNSTSGTAGTLTFNESNKTSDFNTSIFRTGAAYPSISLSLYEPAEIALGGSSVDGIRAVFSTDFGNHIDAGDAVKLESPGENLAWFTATKKLAIDARMPVVDADVLAIKTLRLVANKDYTFKIKSDYTPNVTGYLVDNYLNTQQVIDFTQDYFANFSTTTDAQSLNEDRFKIVFSTALNNNQFTKDAFVVYPNPVLNNQFTIKLPATLSGNVKVTVHNLLGQEVYQVNTTAAPTLEIAPKNILSSGVYVVSVLGEGISSQQKITVQ